MLASRVTADSCAVPPTGRVEVAGDTVTDATGTGAGALTVMADVPLLPSLEAVIVALPAVTAVTNPVAETVATAVLLELQLMTRPVSTALLASRVTADSCAVPPIWSVELAGDTVTDATGTGGCAVTVSAAVPLIPSLVAVIVVLPALIAEMAPVDDTVPTAALEVCQVAARPERIFPLASLRVAVP